jgi:L-rhamnose isomerase
MQRALLGALLEPIETLRAMEAAGDFTARLAMLEEAKTLPAAAVWDFCCHVSNVPVGSAWLDAVKAYERDVLSKR